MRIAVIGHVEHVTLGRVPALPRSGEIAHLEAPRWFPGGGGGVAFFQLTRCPAEVLLFTALGNDEAAAEVQRRLAATRARVHAAKAALVLTEGAAGGAVHDSSGARRFRAPPSPAMPGGSYGAGDSFAGALTWYLATGVPVLEACERAGSHGAAAVGTLDPLQAQIAP